MYNFNNNLFVIRHAPTEENKVGLCLGQSNNTNTTVASLQMLQEHVLSELLAANITLIITSDLKRSKTTANFLNKELNVSAIESHCAFNDLDFGFFTDKPSHLLKVHQPEIYDSKNLFKYP